MLKFIHIKRRRSTKTQVVKYIYDFISRSRRGADYKRRFRNVARHIENFQQKTNSVIYLEDATECVAEEFIYYLKTDARITGKNKGGGLMLSSISTIKQQFGTILSRAKAEGYAVHDGFSRVTVPSEDTGAVYLTHEELRQINAVKLSQEVSAVRDLFLIGCYTALRVSDLKALSTQNIVGENIDTKTKKTGTRVIIPIHPVVREVLGRNGGQFPQIKSEQAFNTAVKRICKKAGINAQVLYERTIGAKVIRRRVKKYELITSHTARRSAATNMYLAGVPIARIMLITGHTTEQTFFKYIRIAKEENAKTLAESEFFKKC